MREFAKLFQTKKYGQILVMVDEISPHNDYPDQDCECECEVKVYFQLDDLNLCISRGFYSEEGDEDGASVDDAYDYFDTINKKQVIKMIKNDCELELHTIDSFPQPSNSDFPTSPNSALSGC